MPLKALLIICFAARRHHNTLLKLYLMDIPLDNGKIMRHNLFITDKKCGIVNKGRPMTIMKKSSKDKHKGLKEQGALNPHPEKVKDELFLDSTLEFFYPHDLVQVKYEMLRYVEKEGRAVTKASKMFGFSRPGFYQVQSQFKQGGITGFIRERPGPKSAHKLTPDVVKFIEGRIKEGEPVRARALVGLIREEFNKQVHPRSIERAIARRKKKGGHKND
jgi:transposase